MLIVYNGSGSKLDDLRYKLYCRKVAASKKVLDTKALPPTSNAAKYHSFRVNCQVQEWKEVTCDPTLWGWTSKQGGLVAIQKAPNAEAAPKELLSVIRCCCKGDCSTQRCTCRKHGIKCSVVCKTCNGISCINGQSVDIGNDEGDGNGND